MKSATSSSSSSQPLPMEIVHWLTTEIDSGRLATGDQLPSERQLCEQFSVSRAVVREALSQLKFEDLITTQQGKGAFVAKRGERHAFRLTEVVLGEENSLLHIMEFLITIEVAATRLAAIRHTDEDLKKIRQALVGMEYAIVNDRLGDEEDYAFHQAIVAATHNPHFKALNEYLDHSVRRLIREARGNTAKNYGELIQDVQDEHQAIFQAIQARDPAKAAEAAERHLRNASKRMNMYLEE
ncbi:FadR family transcriptional regulator (plasmid) [Pseudomonas oryzihabitans]|nr:FadR/GntR family transcriptional regulator [Pseudomonas oryzihabitans]QEU01779.1 FadR family transcriptional regulator [Pseudomonas oryzihabitans]